MLEGFLIEQSVIAQSARNLDPKINGLTLKILSRKKITFHVLK
jgi:hypothetical protein